MEHPAAGRIRQVGCPIKMPGSEPRLERAPYMGEHTDEVLKQLAGLNEPELSDLREKGVVGRYTPLDEKDKTPQG